MKNAKFLKALTALAVGTVMASSIGFAACSPNSGGGGGGGTPTQLEAPTLVNISGKKITWHGVTHADGYTVYEKLKTATTNPVGHDVAVCEYTIDDSVLTPGATYEYYVVATSTSSDYSDSPASTPKVEYTVPQISRYVQLKTGGGNILVDEDFSTTTTIEKGGFDGSNKLYYNKNGNKDADDTKNVVTVENGHAVVKDTSEDATELYINFGPVKGVVEAYFEVKFSAPGGSWTPFQLYGADGEVIGIRTTESSSKVKLNYRLDTTNNNLGAANDIYINDTDTFGVYYKVDLDTGKVTVEVNGVALADELDIGVSSLTGLKLVSSNSGSKTFAEVDNIIVVGEVYEISEYIAAKQAQLEDKYNLTALAEDADLGNISAGVQAKITEQSATITGADYDAVDAAYNAAVAAVDALIVANAKTAACNIVDEYLPAKGGTYTGEQATALNEARGSVKGKINEATVDTLAKVKSALAAGKLEIDEVMNDEEANTPNVVVEVYLGSAHYTLTLAADQLHKVGYKLTKAELDELVEEHIESGKAVESYHLKSLDGTVIDFGTDGYELKEADGDLSGNTVTVKVYVELRDLVPVEDTISFSVIAAADSTLITGSDSLFFSEHADLFTTDGFVVSWTKQGQIKASAATYTDSENEGNNRSFTHLFLPNGGIKAAKDALVITAKAEVTITLFWNSTDSGLANKSDALIYEVYADATATSPINTNSSTASATSLNISTAYKSESITIQKGQVLKFYLKNNRLAVYAIDYSYMG